MWDPLAGVPRVGFLQHTIDLFEGKTLGLGDEHIGVDEAANAKGSPDKEDFGAQIALVCVDHVGGDDSDYLARC